MKPLYMISVLVFLVAASGCSKHDCSLDAPEDQQTFGVLAEATSGASSCFVSNGELVAVHGGTDVAGVAEGYKGKLEGLGYSVELKDHTGQRANGGTFEGKALTASKDGKSTNVLVYPLGDSVIEAVITPK